MLLFILKCVAICTISYMVTLANVVITILNAVNSGVKNITKSTLSCLELMLQVRSKKNQCIVQYWLVISVIKMQNTELGSEKRGLGYSFK